MRQEADICLILEGTYPYVTGGVSTWVHNLIKAHSNFTFCLTSLVPPKYNEKFKYEIPENVVDHQIVEIQTLEPGIPTLSTSKMKKLFEQIERPLLNVQSKATIEDLKNIVRAFDEVGEPIGDRILLLSPEAWRLLVRMYSMSMGNACFLDFFWSWRGLIGGLYSVLLCPLQRAKCYHSLSTGYAGLLMARAHLETGRPCMITEHGIYTNERRIEIASADWIQEVMSVNLNIEREKFERGLKDLWIDTFSSYSRICYDACEKIITLHEGNQPLQLLDGADPEKLMIIPNGINLEKYTSVVRDEDHPPTVALIGRVVPIKDVKTYIRAVSNLKQAVPNLRALVIGPEQEDPVYYRECKEMVRNLKLEGTLHFTGKVNVMEWLPKIDVMVLTSISESQPLTILEAGAAGIPSVATNVGSCQEILYGSRVEEPKLGKGGLVAPLANPQEIALQIEKLLIDETFYKSCSKVIQERVKKYYDEKLQTQAYDELYSGMIA